MPAEGVPAAAWVIAECTRRGLTIAVAESLTGGLLASALIDVPGASAVIRGAIVAYDTALKASLLGVDAALLSEHGPVHPQVATQMASGVRDQLSVGGRPADIGISTTGVAGPDSQDGHPPGEVYLGFAIGDTVLSRRFEFTGGREAIRSASVSESLLQLKNLLGTG